ncbi:MAG: peptide chain release factor N(5)-glutamine methyltransferase [Bacteroidales bacterium]
METPSNNTLDAAWKWMINELNGLYSPEEARAVARELFHHYLGLTPAQRVMQGRDRLTESSIGKLQRALQQLRQHVPVQYVTGITYFHDLTFQVNEKVLIPRRETEELVSWILDTLNQGDHAHRSPVTILDVGTGSGCIALSLGHARPHDKVLACDVDPQVIEVTRSNAARNQVAVECFVADILNDDPVLPNLDVVVSNPPYVREQEKTLMQKNVLDYEPGLALFVKDHDPLIFYRAISRKAFQWLSPGGLLFFEINEYLGEETRQLVEAAGFSQVVLRQDLQGKDRFIRAIK